jgi:molecular chaperone GrpE
MKNLRILSHHIQKHSPLNEKFDHNLHQALFDIPNDEAEVGTILQVVQPGYTLNDRLLRPAMVGVSKKGE